MQLRQAYLAQDDLELLTLLSLPKCWNYRHSFTRVLSVYDAGDWTQSFIQLREVLHQPSYTPTSHLAF